MKRKPELDEILIAPYKGIYYRGKVTSVDGNQVDVRFVDYGDKAKVKISDCKELSEAIKKVW